MMKTVYPLLVFLLIVGCRKKPSSILKAGREAPIGGVYLELFSDNTFELRFSRLERPKSGTYKYLNDTLYFSFVGKVDSIRSKAVVKGNIICFKNKYKQIVIEKDCSDFTIIETNRIETLLE